MQYQAQQHKENIGEKNGLLEILWSKAFQYSLDNHILIQKSFFVYLKNLNMFFF